MSSLPDITMNPVKDPAEKHRKAALAKFDDGKTPDQRTFSIKARMIDDSIALSILLSLDDNITEVLERIRDKFGLEQTPIVWVSWIQPKEEVQRSLFEEHNI